MPPQINFSDSGHLVPPTVSYRYLPFIRLLDGGRIQQLETAMRCIEAMLIRTPCRSCDQAFRSLSRHRSFRQIWSIRGIWISYTPSVLDRGYTHSNRRDIAISLDSFGANPGEWRPVAATLIHELAHVGGAPTTTSEAERVLLECGFADQFDSSIIG